MSKTWSVDEHLEDILRSIRPLDPIELKLLDAQGCVLVEDVIVPAALPPFDNSSMDGYAVRIADVQGASEDFPAVLTVIGDIAAGSADLPSISSGQAARIMTGAPCLRAPRPSFPSSGPTAALEKARPTPCGRAATHRRMHRARSACTAPSSRTSMCAPREAT